MFFRLLFFVLIANICLAAKEIAITIDDAPKGHGALFSGVERTNKIIEALKGHQAMFFCNTSRLNPTKKERLRKYSKFKHLIANHTHSHLDFNTTSVEDFYENLLKAEFELKKYSTFVKFFRFPYLREGETALKRDKLREILDKENYLNGYVTVDNYEWYIDSLLQKTLRKGEKVDFNKLKELYLKTIIGGINFYEKISKKYISSNVKHILLLHENDLAALFLKDLIIELKSQGWSIISPTEAYTKSELSTAPDTLFNGQGRVAAIASIRGAKPTELVSKYEDKDYLDSLFLNVIKK